MIPLGRYLYYFSLALLVPLGVAIFYDFFWERGAALHTTGAFAWTLLITALLSFIFISLGRRKKNELSRRESIFLVGGIWFLTAALAALPFIFSGTLPKPLDAYFEAMSGLTTTGATLIAPNAVEAVAKPLLFWRCFLQWLGGMGIILLFIAVLPTLSGGGRFLFEAEITGPNKEALKPRIKETASLLWRIYFGLTALEIILLLLFCPALSFFEAVTLALSTLSTGGFTIKNGGIASYNLGGAEWIPLLFMILGSINFTLYFYCIKGKIYRLYEPEFVTFIITMLAGCLLVSFTLLQILPFGEALKQGFSYAISTQTSTGFPLNSQQLWPFSAQFVLLILAFIGGMSGSTAGGIKIARFYILFRVIGQKIESIFRPASVRYLRIGSKEISDKTALNVSLFICILLLLTALGTFLLILDGIDGATAIGVIASTINNSGVSLGLLGSGSYDFLPPLSKIVSIVWMVFGRLELFILLVFLFPSFWKGK